MRAQKSAAREISYSTTAKTLRGRVFIRGVENATGRMRVMRQVRGYDKAMSQGHVFWNVVPDLCGLELDVISGSLDNIPKSGPVVLLSNHPYGILDGLMLGQILSRTRDDFLASPGRVGACATSPIVPSQRARASSHSHSGLSRRTLFSGCASPVRSRVAQSAWPGWHKR